MSDFGGMDQHEGESEDEGEEEADHDLCRNLLTLNTVSERLRRQGERNSRQESSYVSLSNRGIYTADKSR